jgi:hypothetical protein
MKMGFIWALPRYWIFAAFMVQVTASLLPGVPERRDSGGYLCGNRSPQSTPYLHRHAGGEGDRQTSNLSACLILWGLDPFVKLIYGVEGACLKYRVADGGLWNYNVLTA